MSLIYLFSLCLMLTSSLYSAPDKLTIVLDPGVSYDQKVSAETHTCINLIKQKIETSYPSIRIITSRLPHESVDTKQTASFVNRLNPELYISIHFALTKEATKHIHVYTYAQNPVTDYWKTSSSGLEFIQIHKAHITHASLSRSLSQAMTSTLEKLYKHTVTVNKPYALPFKPLQGIQAPAVALEMTVNSDQDCQLYLDGIAQGIISLIPALPEGTHRDTL